MRAPAAKVQTMLLHERCVRPRTKGPPAPPAVTTAGGLVGFTNAQLVTPDGLRRGELWTEQESGAIVDPKDR